MTIGNPYLDTNRWLKLDHILGLRALGLVIYGTLPTSLFALGILEITFLDILKVGLILPFLVVIVIPIVVLFLLVRERVTSWYLLRTGLNSRTLVITVAILLLSTIISFAAGYVTGKYPVLSWSDWFALNNKIRWNQILESFIIAIAALVGSSTLFITAIKDESGLPGLPSSEFVQNIQSLRKTLVIIMSESIWRTSKEINSLTLSKNISVARDICLQMSHQRSLAPQNESFCDELANDLSALDSVVKQVERTVEKWSDYFSVNTPLGLNRQDQELRKAIWKLARIKFDA